MNIKLPLLVAACMLQLSAHAELFRNPILGGGHNNGGDSTGRASTDAPLTGLQDMAIRNVTNDSAAALSASMSIHDRNGDKVVSKELLDKTKCIVTMKVTRGAFLLGGSGGEGLMVCRLPNGGWSAPSYVRTGSFELSAAIGFDSTNITMFVTDDGLAQSFKSQLNFGAKAYAKAVAASAGLALEASNKYGMAVVQTNSQGLFAGVGISFSSFSHMQAGRNQNVYADSLGDGTPVDSSGRRCDTYIRPLLRQSCLDSYEQKIGRKVQPVTADKILSSPAQTAPQITRAVTDILENK